MYSGQAGIVKRLAWPKNVTPWISKHSFNVTADVRWPPWDPGVSSAHEYRRTSGTSSENNVS